MTQVELALKEKSGETHKYRINLVSTLFGENKGIKLQIPFGNDLQKRQMIGSEELSPTIGTTLHTMEAR